MTWYNVDPSKFLTGTNGSLEKLIDGSAQAAASNESGFTAPFEITYTFNGFFSNQSAIGFSDASETSWHYGYGYFMTFNGTNDPKLGTNHNGGSTISGYGLPSLSSGLNTVTFKMNAGGTVSIVVNGTEVILGSITPSVPRYAGARLLVSGEKIESTSLIVG